MRGTYVLRGDNLTVVNAVVTLAFIRPPTNAAIEIIRASVSQSGSATSAQQRVQIVTQVTAFPTLTGATPAPTSLLDAISQIVSGTAGAAGTAGVNASAEGAGTKSPIVSEAFNVLNGWLWIPSPNDTIVIPAGSASGVGIYLPTAPATLTGWHVDVTFRELG